MMINYYINQLATIHWYPLEIEIKLSFSYYNQQRKLNNAKHGQKKAHQCEYIRQEEDSLYRALTIYSIHVSARYMKKVTILSDDN